MADTFPGDTLIQGRVIGQQETGTACENVFKWWLYVNPPTAEIPRSDVLTQITGKLSDIFMTMRDWLPANTKWDEVELMYFLPGGSEWLHWTSVPIGLAGNDGADDLPSGVSATLTGHTATPKRRARKFLPAFSERASNNQTWTAGALTALASIGVKWLTGTNIPGFEAWFYPIAQNVASGLWSALTGVRANAIPGYQRRRKPGVGR